MFFNKPKAKPEWTISTQLQTIELSDEQRREEAIEYITGLTEADFERFVEAIGLIWKGYNILNRVKTRAEKQAEKDKKEDDMFNQFIGNNNDKEN